MAGGIQEQLEQLRRRIAALEQRTRVGAAPAPRPLAAESSDETTALPGAEVESSIGRHWEIEKLHERHRRHGSMYIADLAELPPTLFASMSNGEIRDAPPEQWVFLDTETTGLAGGAGTYAFLIGVGRITAEGFHVRQFFMREPGEESSVLEALALYLKPFRVMVTYNGKAFDQPLLETRFRMARAKPPFSSMDHLDLLYGARRLWKLRLESCRLVELENRILGYEREGDVPGELIPSLYFDYLRTGRAAHLAAVFHHNALDILTLACLCGIVPRAFEPEGAPVGHPAEMVGIGRWWRQMGEPDKAAAWLRSAMERGLTGELLYRTMWDAAALEKKMGRHDAAAALWQELSTVPNPFRTAALEEAAKYFEHCKRDPERALQATRLAIDLDPGPEWERRRARLERKLAAGRGLL